jgi:hypothetical protein
MNNIPEITNRYVLPTIEEKTAYGFKRLDPYTLFSLANQLMTLLQTMLWRSCSLLNQWIQIATS